MSLSVPHISCTGCNFHKGILPTRVKFESLTGEGDRLQASRSIGWCCTCNTIVEMEITDVKELAKDVATLENELLGFRTLQIYDPEHKDGSFTISQLIEWSQNDLGKTRRFVDAIAWRESPARCMLCWGTEAKRLRFNEEGLCDDFRHSCGGQLKHGRGGGLRIMCKDTGDEAHPLTPQGVHDSMLMLALWGLRFRLN